MAGVGKNYAKQDYSTEDYQKFFLGLQFLAELEDLMFLESDMSIEDY